MTGIYQIIDGKVFLHKQAVKLCPTLSCLPDPELKYLITVYDYVGGPLRGQPESKRKQLAVSFFFPDEKDKKNRIVQTEGQEYFPVARQELQSIIYNPDKDSYDTYIEKIHQLDLLIKDCGPSDIKGYITAQNALRVEADKLHLRIEKSDVAMINIELKGGKKLSFLEQWKMNRELYNRMHARS